MVKDCLLVGRVGWGDDMTHGTLCCNGYSGVGR